MQREDFGEEERTLERESFKEKGLWREGGLWRGGKMGKKGEIQTISRLVLVPDPMNGQAGKRPVSVSSDVSTDNGPAGSRGKRVSIASSVISDVSTDNGEAANLQTFPPKSKLRRWETGLCLEGTD